MSTSNTADPQPNYGASFELGDAELADCLQALVANQDSGEVRARLETAISAASDVDDPTNVWNADELLAAFEVSHFEPPYVHVIRRSSGVRGTVLFVDEPRFYFSFVPVAAQELAPKPC